MHYQSNSLQAVAELETITITKLVPGGQGLGMTPSGKKVFVWNALPGEMVRVRILKQRASYAEGVAEVILKSSAERTEPKEENFLATSPWQIMTFASENPYKEEIVREIFRQQGIGLPNMLPIVFDDRMWHYRNKMEYSFWGDETGLHLALHRRESHSKQVVKGCELAMPEVDIAARAMATVLNSLPIRASELKTIIVRSSQAGKVVAALFVRIETLPMLTLPAELMGLRVYYSNPKSPASVRTKLLQQYGNCKLADGLLDKHFAYDVDAFFQINVPVYAKAVASICDHCAADDVIDMYAGVGSIGLTVARHSVRLIELDMASAAMAKENAATSSLQTGVIQASADQALEYIDGSHTVIFDPPRAGLHTKIIRRVLDVLPPYVVYLSCNPATQARDIALLQSTYSLTYFQAFNFFPRTPHIETLAILKCAA